MSGSTTIAEAVLRARDGDRDAWNEIVERFSPMVWAVIRSVGVHDAEASDAQAATWMKLLTRIDSIRSPERLPGWLRTTARNEAIAVIRRRSRIDAVDPERFDWDESADRGPAEQLEAADDIQRVRAALIKLDQRCRELLTLLFGEPAMSYAEVAVVIDRPIGTIGPTRQRCLKKLEALVS